MKIVRLQENQQPNLVGLRCDRCAREARRHKGFSEAMEQQEFLQITYAAGYGSTAFIDTTRYELDLCQCCLAKIWGPWLRACLG